VGHSPVFAQEELLAEFTKLKERCRPILFALDPLDLFFEFFKQTTPNTRVAKPLRYLIPKLHEQATLNSFFQGKWMVESRTFYTTRCDDDQSETGTPPQGNLRRRHKKSRVGKVTTQVLFALQILRRAFDGIISLKNQIEKLTSLRRSPKYQELLGWSAEPLRLVRHRRQSLLALGTGTGSCRATSRSAAHVISARNAVWKMTKTV
jgi:hypothetical protein